MQNRDIDSQPLPGVHVTHRKTHSSEGAYHETGIRFDQEPWRWIRHESKRPCKRLMEEREAAVYRLVSEWEAELEQMAAQLLEKAALYRRVILGEQSRELGEVMRVAFITLNPRDDLRLHVPWCELTDEKRARYNGAAAAVVRAHTGQKLPGSGVA